MSLTAAASGFVVFLLCVQVIQGHNDWGVTYSSTDICALKGTTVEISCRFRYSSRTNGLYTTVQETFWFTKWNRNGPVDLRTDSQYSGRVESHCENNICSLRIRDLRESDSAEYKFRFITNQPYRSFTGSPGVTLSVTDLQVKVERQYPYTSRVTLTCHSSCQLPDHPSYIWYKNWQKVPAETSYSFSRYFNSADSFSCAVRGQEAFPSPTCAIGQTCNTVTYTHRSICAFKGSSVDISCSYNSHNQVQSKFWFSPERSHQWQSPSQPEDLSEDSHFKGRVHIETKWRRSTLTITDLRESDSAEYHFKFKAGRFEWTSSLPGTILTVTALQVLVIRKTVYHSQTNAELKCLSSCSPAAGLSYVWFKNRREITWEKTSSYKGWFNPSDVISCALKGHESYRSPPVFAPKLPSVSVSPSGEIVEGSSVTLNCSSDANPAANYTWYKENVNFKPLCEDQQLVFSSIKSSDSGEYYCTAENELRRMTSEHIFIDVKYPPKLPSVSVSPSGKIMEGSSVTLTCSSDAKPAASYTWYKENQTLTQIPTGIYRLTSISSEDRGNYYCKSMNPYGQIDSSSVLLDVQYPPKLPSVSLSPSGEIVEGSSVTLTCSSDANPAANYTWYKENVNFKRSSKEPQLVLISIQSSDSGEYYCTAENELRRMISKHIFIDVKYPPKLPSVSVSPSGEIVEGSSVTLTCSSDANPAANYTWYKENEDSPKASGPIFIITDFRFEHSGNYYCEAQNSQGRHNSTLHLIVVSGSMKSAAAGSITAILLVIIFLFAFLLIRRKRSSKQTSERPDNRTQLNMGLVCGNSSAAVQRTQAEEQDDLCYASVSFSKNQEDPLYSNIGAAQLNRHKNEEEEEEDKDDVEYTLVNVKPATASPELRRPDDVEDSSALYSTVSKTARA